VRLGLIQVIYVGCAVALALVMPLIDVSPFIRNARVTSLFFAFAGGLIALIAVVFSLLFLVVPYANSSLTPRLTLFRDNPFVWHAFSFFIGVFVFLTASGIALGNDDRVSFLVPVIALLIVLASLIVVRALQFRAYRSVQFGITIMDVTAAGERVLDALYVDAIDAHKSATDLAPLHSDVRWTGGLCMLRQVDTARLLRIASAAGAVIEFKVRVGEELRRDMVVASVRGASGVDSRELFKAIETGPDRTFAQDPLFAFRLLVDIALRAVSPAINDPITAVQATAGIHELLHVLIDRDLDAGAVAAADGTVRVVLKVPEWEDYLSIGVDELVPYVRSTPQVSRRLAEMVDALLAEAPPSRRPMLESRRSMVATS
jgi:uncharacterized membrane protein